MLCLFVVKNVMNFLLKLYEGIILKRKEKLCTIRITEKEDRKVSRE
jgi:hypothetical protein